MSSHHFVKEGQEPAVFVIDALSLELIEPLLEWAPMVMVADTIIDDAIRWGFKIDVVLTHDGKQSEIADKMEMQIPYSVIPYPKNENLITAGFAFLSERKQSAVHLIANSTALFDTLDQFTETFDITLLDSNKKWSHSKNNKFEKWLPAGTILQVRNTKPQQQFDVQHLNAIAANSYGTKRDGMVQIVSAEPFWIGE